MTADDQRQSKFAWMLAFVVVAFAIFGYFLFESSYVHPMPASDCSQPYDYGMCARAVEPTPIPPPTQLQTILGSLLALAIMAVLFVASYRASVTSQQELVVRTSAAQAPSASAPAQPAQQQPVQQPQPAAQPQAQQAKDAWGHPLPPAIPMNARTPIAPPPAAPKQGVDPKTLGGNP